MRIRGASTHKTRLRLQAAVVSVATVLNVGTILVVAPTTAFAATACGGTQTPDDTLQGWLPAVGTPVPGIRAPITPILDAAPCKPTNGLPQSFTANWIGIEQQKGSLLAQIGFVDDYDASMGGSLYCRFWATQNGVTNFHTYGSCAPPSGQAVYFLITTVLGKYNIYDCGASATYSITACILKDASQGAFGSAEGVEVAENDYAKCVTVEMGGKSDHATIGSTAHPIQYQPTVAGSWTNNEPLTKNPPVCTKYGYSFSQSVMNTWDTDNS